MKGPHFLRSSSSLEPGRPMISVCSIARFVTSPPTFLQQGHCLAVGNGRAVAEDREHEAVSEEVLHRSPLTIDKGVADVVLVLDWEEQFRRPVGLAAAATWTPHHAEVALLAGHAVADRDVAVEGEHLRQQLDSKTPKP
jgi:hypothetical protein